MLSTIKTWHLRRMSKCDTIELEQSLIRIIVIGIIMAYVFYGDHGASPYIVSAFLVKMVELVLVASFVLAGVIYLSDVRSVLRRVVGAWMDIGSITIFMFFSDKIGLFMIGVYLWVVFGNGFRFGNKYLFHAQILSLAGFYLVAVKNPYWQVHQSLASSVFLMLVALPVYVAALTYRLNKARREAEHANAAKTRFVAHMSHEIRTPLNGIVGIGTLLKATPLNSDQRDLLDTLDGSSRLLMSLLNNVLDITKIEEGKTSVDISEFSAVNLADETVKIFRSQAESKSVHLTANVQPGLGRFLGDHDHLQQVLANLVGNAIKFTDQGSVTLTVSHVPGSASDTLHEVVRFEVIDTGIGIADIAQDIIFEAFAQEKRATAKHYGGCGLGLHIARHLVASMGGKLLFNSKEGMGSRFWFDLSLQKITHSQEITMTDNLTPSKMLDILICEDDATNQKILRRLMELAGHSATLVNSGEEMLDQLDHGRFDVVIADLNMGGMNGVDALKFYRFTHAEDTRTRFIMLTADATEAARTVAHQARFDAFMTKPVDARAIYGVISGLMGMPHATADDWLANAISCANKKSSAETNDDGERPLDAKTLRELEILGSDDSLFVHGLLQNYLRDSETMIEKIDMAIKNKNHDELREHCHALNGSSLSVGATAVHLRAEAINNAEPGEIRFRGHIMASLLRADYVTTRAAIEDYLTQRMMVTG